MRVSSGGLRVSADVGLRLSVMIVMDKVKAARGQQPHR
jgi:hypothetical protein